MKAPRGRGKLDPRRPRDRPARSPGKTGVEPVVHGIKRKKERRNRKGETDTRHGKVEEKGRRGGRLEIEETEESVRAPSLATRSRTPVPTQHGTASHNRWKGNGGERHGSGRRGREEDERERERDR